jgi:hypothetical protein
MSFYGISASPLTACNPSITIIITAINKMDSNPASFPHDSLPPQRWYVSQEDLFIDISIWAATRGFTFITRRSTIGNSGQPTVTYSCNQFRSGCQFSILATEEWSGDWLLKHRAEA